MGPLFKRLKRYFSGGKAEPALSLEEMRSAFKAKYHAFKLLLAANNAALQLMTDLEAALHGNHSFGMTFIRSHATAVCVNVFSLIRYLNELSGNKYQALGPVFSSIEGQITQVLKKRQAPTIQELVLPLSQVHKEMADGVGSKMANLGEIQSKLPGLTVPGGFVITAAAYELFLSHNQLQDEINRRLQALEEEELADLYRKSSEIQRLIIGSDLPPSLTAAISQAFQDLEARTAQPLKVALRSSAIGEDAVDTSFAGQYRSELNVRQEHLFSVYKEILASKYALTAVSYRLRKGLRDEDVAMCVGCMAMVEAEVGGVMYSRDPTDIRNDAIFINAVHGLAKSVVDGTVTPDLWVISREEPWTIIRKEIRDKPQKVVCLPTEGVYLETDEQGQAPALTDAQALALAQIALTLEDHFHTPQDIEWCMDKAGRIQVLQSRPLKQLALPSREAAAVFASAENPVLLRGGEVASPGVAAGPVYVVKSNLDLLQFPEGAVLVTAFPHPSWAPLLSRASAVVTDRGGITGHLANVAREFRVPALFNTAEATQQLKPGTVITVDADGHTLYQGKVEALLALPPAPRGLMAGTPVYETLKETMAFITPLYLTDPDGPDFKAPKCRTLHDITRFAHEVSVKEMFALDKHGGLAQYFIKRLVTEVGLQWWVLDLEDGFKQEVPGKEVELGNIASAPMLALWDGITAVPWAGPPPVDTRGFMSIVMGAATDPNLATAGGTIFGNQNYFMISRDFCNLTSRLGFHFSTVEALVGEQPFENYLRFAFKGGAADYPRRVLRAKLVGEILERYDFKVDVKEDALFARLEGEDKDYMLSRLRLLGYVTIHTRQIDMIMLNADEVAYYRDKIISDIEKFILPTDRGIE
jgi:pyruvate,water dikinase